MERAKASLKIVYRGGEADQNRLDLYDGAESNFGFAKALSIASHAFVRQAIVHHATAAKGVRLYLGVPSAGSYVEFIQAVITDPNFMLGVGTGVVTNAFYDFLKFSLSRAAGLFVEPETSAVRQQFERDEPFFDELADVLEGPLRDAHRTIKMSGGTISLERPRSPLVTFDRETLDWVTTRELDDTRETVIGNVTRYNVISKNGRLFNQKLGRVIPFKPDGSLGEMSQRLLTRSLDDTNHRLPGILDFTVQPVVSARGAVKRYILMACTKPGALTPVTAAERA